MPDRELLVLDRATVHELLDPQALSGPSQIIHLVGPEDAVIRVGPQGGSKASGAPARGSGFG